MSDPLIEIIVYKDYTVTPGPRDPSEGNFSGEDFLKMVLEPCWLLACAKKGSVFVDLDLTEGYATSFLEAAFGGLARKYGINQVLSGVHFKSDEEPYLIDEIQSYIRDANKK